MQKYLIFFGKSQAFTFYAFNEQGLIPNFNEVIKDFSLLESTFFTVDITSNEEILAKYNFKTSKGEEFSLLKLYSFAQAYDGGRVAGSIYGVALLSDYDVCISETNNNLLNSAKKKFANYSLIEKKFNKSDFLDDVYKIFRAFHVNYGFAHINVNGKPTISSFNTQNGYYTPELLVDSIRLGSEINTDCSRLYFSDDEAHLKRTSQKWGDKFPIYHNANGKYVQYKEEYNTVSAPVPNNLNTHPQQGFINQPVPPPRQSWRKHVIAASLLLNIVFFIRFTFFNNPEKKMKHLKKPVILKMENQI
jgi:hypothetical protein